MSVFAEYRESHDLVGSRTFRARRRCGVVHLGSLLALVALCQAVAPANADDVVPKAVGRDASPLGMVFSAAIKTVAADNSDRLITEPENPEEYQALVADSLYPPTDPPHKLTLEQLEAIAKLAPRPGKAGWRIHPAMLPLFRSMVLHYTGGTYKNSPIRFRLHTPEPYQEGKKYPLVVWLHGVGQCGSDNINQLCHLHHMIPYLVGPKKRDFFLLVPQCPQTHTAWEAPEICSTTVRADGSVECHLVDDPVELGNAPIAYTLAMIDAVKREFPVDPNQITVAGLSSGGDGVWQIVQRRPGLFAAAAPIVSWSAYREKSLRENPLLKKVPTWAIYSSDDRAIDFARKEFERVREAGCNVHKTEFGVCGHRAWTPAMLQGDVFGWLISRTKEGGRYFAARPSPTSPETIGIFADVTEGDLKRVPTPAPARAKTIAALNNLLPTLAAPAQIADAWGPRTKDNRIVSPTPTVPMAVAPPGYTAPTVPAPTVTSPTVAPSPVPTATPYVGTSYAPYNTGTIVKRNVSPTPAAPMAVAPYSVTAPTVPATNIVPSPVPLATPYVAMPSSPNNTSPNYSLPSPSGSTSSYPVASPYMPYASAPSVASVDQCRLVLICQYIGLGEAKKALAVADKVKDRHALVRFLLQNGGPNPEVLEYVDRELDRLEQRGEAQGAAVPRLPRGLRLPEKSEQPGEAPGAAIPGPTIGEVPEPPRTYQPPRVVAGPLKPIPEGKKSPKDDCGKEWEMSTDTLYGLFPNGWDRESNYVPDYVINETGKQLRERLFKVFAENDLAAMKEFCASFIRLDDIPLSSPWFDTSGGRLQGRIKYALNEKSKPVVELLREIAAVKAESKKPLVELARKALVRIDAIVRPKNEK
jgi:predicted esterase